MGFNDCNKIMVFKTIRTVFGRPFAWEKVQKNVGYEDPTIRTCVRNLDSVFLSPNHAPTVLNFHVDRTTINIKIRLVFA